MKVHNKLFTSFLITCYRVIYTIERPLSRGKKVKKEHNHAVGNESVRALRYSPLSHRALAPPVPAPPHAGEPPLSGASRQLSRRESQVYARGWRLNSGKANKMAPFAGCFPQKEPFPVWSPHGGRARRAQGVHLWVAGCAAEALPAAETAEAEQGQRSVFCEGAATPEAKAGHRNPGGLDPEAKAGHRNPGGLDNNNAGASFTADPRRGTLSFVTQKFFCFGAINNRRNIG